jgi:acyl carrier protein
MTGSPRAVTLEEIADFICSAANVDRTEVKLDARLLEDLKIDGDDADELMIGYATHFGVDMSEYRFLDYFGWEGDPTVWGFWLHLWCLISSRARNRLAEGESWSAPLTVSHLVRCAKDGVWHHPILPQDRGATRQKNIVLHHSAALLWRMPFILILLFFALGLPVVALAKPVLPQGLFLLGLGLVFVFLFVGAISPARHYYRDRVERGRIRQPVR